MSSEEYEGLTKEDLRIFHGFIEQMRNINSWTPAMLAMMICGIRPVPGCSTIPDQGTSLLKSNRAAKKSDIKNAKHIIERWLDGEVSCYEKKFTKKEKLELLSTPVEPMDFFIDCYQDGVGASAPLLREFIDLDSESGNSLFTAARLATELWELQVKTDHENSLLERMQIKNSPIKLPGRDLDNELKDNQFNSNSIIHKIEKSPLGRQSDIVKLLVAAESQVDTKDYNNAKIVYQKCIDLARDDPNFCPNIILKTERQLLYYRWLDAASEKFKLYEFRLVSARIKRRVDNLNSIK